MATNFKLIIIMNNYTIIVYTSNLEVGIADSIPVALQNAKYRSGQEVHILLYDCNKADLNFLSDGLIGCPKNTKYFDLTNGFKFLK